MVFFFCQEGMWGIIKVMKVGYQFYYLFDMDFGLKELIFVLFFGVQVVIILGVFWLVCLIGVKVVVCIIWQVVDGYEIEVMLVWENFLGESVEVDMVFIN